MEKNAGFRVYKGLQKPLVFKNLKGRYIFWAGGALGGSFLLCIVVGMLVSMIYGLISLFVSAAVSMGYVLYRQSKGLYSHKTAYGYYTVRRIIRQPSERNKFIINQNK